MVAVPGKTPLGVLAFVAAAALLLGTACSDSSSKGSAPRAAAPSTVVSLTFDDGSADQYRTLDLLHRRGMTGTYYVNSALVGSSGYYLTWPRLYALRDAGNEIGGHTLNHVDLTTVSLAQARRQVCDDRTNLVRRGFSATSFAYPFAARNRSVEKVVAECGYRSARGVGNIRDSEGCRTCSNAETIPPADPFATRTPAGILAGATLAELEADVTRAEDSGGGWVQLAFHGICDNRCTGDVSLRPAIFTAFLDWLRPRAANGTVVRTVGQAMAASAAARPTVPTVAGTTGLKVSGNTITNAARGAVRLHGFNHSGTEYACIEGWGIFDSPDPGRPSGALVRAMASWRGANVVRVPLNEQCWLGIGVPEAYGGIRYRAAIHDFVDLLNKNGLVAVLDLHRSAPGTSRSLNQEQMPDRDHSIDFWRQVARAYRDNPSVIFDLFNEPFPYGETNTARAWRCWRDGGCTLTSTNGGTAYVAAGMNDLVKAVRDAGAPNIVLAGGIHWAESLTQWLTYKPADPLGNIGASFHAYALNEYCASPRCYDTDLAHVASQVPLFAGEVGPDQRNDSCTLSSVANTGFSRTIFDWLDSHGGSYTAWTWNNWNDCWSLVADRTGTPTPVWGSAVKDRLAGSAHLTSRK